MVIFLKGKPPAHSYYQKANEYCPSAIFSLIVNKTSFWKHSSKVFYIIYLSESIKNIFK